MKKKLLALFLCCVMVFSLVPVALTSAFATGSGFQIYSSNGTVAETVLLQMSEKMDLTAVAETGSGNYQWQIRVSGDVWANIVGTSGNTLELSYGLVANALDNDAAEIRCKLTNDVGNVSYSNIVTVQIQPDSTVRRAPAASPAVGTVISEAQPIGEPVIVPADAPSYYGAPAAVESDADAEPAPVSDDTAADGNDDSVPVNDPAPVNDTPANDVPADETPANDTPTPTTYTILINYIFADGKQAAPSWSATVATGSTYTQDIQSPVVVGYTPEQAVVHVEVSEAKIYTVTYQPAEVEFTVKHYQQNVSNDEYTLADTETKKGFTESAVGERLAKTDYTGFYSLLYDTTTTIAADGSTVVEVYYDRYYYLMNFDLDGGYGVEPIYARFGAPISVDTPTKPGYTFESWTPSIPSTMPDKNTSYTASWKIGESGFTVVFWYENANDDGYSVAGTYQPQNVAPGREVSSSDYKNQKFDGRDGEHFTYNANKAETVTVKGDGSTVLNVYYTRNSYTLTFPDCQKTLTCTKVEHKHTHAQCCTKDDGHWFSCNTKKCPVGYEHTHSNRCYKTSDLTITAKYDSDITSVWRTDPIKSLLNQGYVFQSSVTDKYYSFLEKMPGQNITMTKTLWSGSTYEWYYYLEVPAGMSAPAGATTKTDGGKTYYLYHTVTIKGDGIELTYDEDYYPITGYTQRDENVPNFDKYNKAYLYYTRNTYDLKFFSNGENVKTEKKYYQADISGENFTPDYPATLEPNAYRFGGWYTDQFFSDDGEFSFDNATMPASPVVLYAYWAPWCHTVKAYLTKDAMDNGKQPLFEESPDHGQPVLYPPADPKRDPYKFVGWFYISDTGAEKAFDFSMPVNRDLNLYAKWSSNTLMNFEVRYELEDGTEIAQPFTGSALAGSTKTFNAKTGTQLNKDYQSGYFPKVSSHSITIDIADASKNKYTFVYVAKDEVEYTVRYLDKTTGEPVVVDGVPTPDKVVKTRDAVVTETFKQLKGYAPDAYQKQLVLAAEGNEIIFWYVKDDAHAPVRVIHWQQNLEGDGYTERQSSTNLNGVIGTEYSEEPLKIAGFRYNGEKSNAKGTLTAEGLVLNLYYDRIEYPYEFRFVEKDSDPEKEVAPSETGKARYQKLVTQRAKDIPGYTLVSAENLSINIAIEDGTTAVKNVKTFYYTEQTVDIKYEVVGPDGCGTLDNYQDAQLKVTTGAVKGSTPAAADGFKFVGWYKDKECMQPVDADWVKDNKLTPGKTKNYGTAEKPVMGYEAATYYAKFEWDVADLTITKQGWENIDEGQSFIFDVTGPNGYSKRVVINGNGTVTIKGLKIGAYTVTEVTNWSWRYTADSNSRNITLNPTLTNAVTFVNARSNHRWLGGDAYSKNIFGN